MTTTTRPRTPDRTRAVRWGLGDASFWLALALIASSVIALPVVQLAIAKPLVIEALSYLLVWTFLLGGVLVASYARGRRSLVADFGLRFTWIDLLWGLGTGFVLRGVSSLIETTIYGARPTGSVVVDAGEIPLSATIALTAAGVLVAPVIEELFFRGLVLRAVEQSTRASRRTATVMGIGVSALVFSVVHMLQLPVGIAMVAVGVSTLIAGVALGTLAALTGRLGGAIVAHMAFNATALVGVG